MPSDLAGALAKTILISRLMAHFEANYERNASRLSPSDIVTEFVFAAASTVTIPVIQQASLDALIEPQDYSQTGGDGALFRYDCQESLVNKGRKANKKQKESEAADKVEATGASENSKDRIPTYHCGGVIRIRLSIKRDAVNAVYKHNPSHRDVESQRSGESNSASPEANGNITPNIGEASHVTINKKKRTKKNRHVAIHKEFLHPRSGHVQPARCSEISSTEKGRSNGTEISAMSAKSLAKKKSRASQTASAPSPSKSRKKAGKPTGLEMSKPLY
ncbi:hypothetical protein SVAN01_11290 [Stagonosporopsis vannaccii]|nr:hypothetical protein SVAN01_11290 [Stagonosporopsis vannaccii]